MIDLSEYRLETLHQEEEFILYRGLHQTKAETSPLSVLALSPIGPRTSVKGDDRLPFQIPQVGHRQRD